MAGTITNPMVFRHASLPGVEVYAQGEIPTRGQPQEVLVRVEPNGIIRPHSHESDARMFVVNGSGTVLSEDPETNNTEVTVGHCVFFEKQKEHGFQAGPNGLSFVSTNDGIVDGKQEWDINLLPS
ncbi:MAG: hypothetical protein DHS20C02_13210 [Micavibrio sp.]|nr:MAG: hypothetical protein DHS20C02_13210 [Micavibrio sp.]